MTPSPAIHQVSRGAWVVVWVFTAFQQILLPTPSFSVDPERAILSAMLGGATWLFLERVARQAYLEEWRFLHADSATDRSVLHDVGTFLARIAPWRVVFGRVFAAPFDNALAFALPWLLLLQTTMNNGLDSPGPFLFSASFLFFVPPLWSIRARLDAVGAFDRWQLQRLEVLQAETELLGQLLRQQLQTGEDVLLPPRSTLPPSSPPDPAFLNAYPWWWAQGAD